MSKKNNDESVQDVFLANNQYIVGQDIDAPRNGACTGQDPSIFFPVLQNRGHNTIDLNAQQKAIGICRGCSIRTKCLLYSLEYEPLGIWGGFTETQRSILGYFWQIVNKRPWRIKASFLQYRQVMDYVINPEDIKFIEKVAHEQNFTQPSFDERSSVSSAARRRFSEGLANSTNR